MAFPTYFQLDLIARTYTRWTPKDMCVCVFFPICLNGTLMASQLRESLDSLLLRDDNNNSSLYTRQLPTYWNWTLYRSDVPRGRRSAETRKQTNISFEWMWSDSQSNASSFVYFYIWKCFNLFFLFGSRKGGGDCRFPSESGALVVENFERKRSVSLFNGRRAFLFDSTILKRRKKAEWRELNLFIAAISTVASHHLTTAAQVSTCILCHGRHGQT